MKILVVGDGLIGSTIKAKLLWQRMECGDELISTTRKPGRANGKSVLYLDLAKPPMELPKDLGLVFLCAGINGFRECAISLSWRTNVDGVLDVAERLLLFGGPTVFVVYISTSAVEWSDDPYARQRWAVEQGLRAFCYRRAVIRPEKVTPENSNGFAQYAVDIGLNQRAGLHRWVA